MASASRHTTKRERALTALFLITVGLTAATAVADTDIWWHLAAARQMLADGRWLQADPFSVSALGRPWTNVHWLFQLGAYGVYRSAGTLGLVLAKVAVVVTGAAVLLAAFRDSPLRLRGSFMVLFAAALLLARHSLLVRPTLVTLVFLSLFFVRLERFAEQGHARRLLWLPAMQVVWANCQGLSALGPALVTCALVGSVVSRPAGPAGWRRPRALGQALAACLLAQAMTPYGLSGLSLPLKLLLRIVPNSSNVFSQNIVENTPPLTTEIASPGTFWHLGVFLVLLAGSFVLQRRTLSVTRLLMGGLLVALALMANRNVLLLYWLGVPILVLNTAAAFGRLPANGTTWPAWAVFDGARAVATLSLLAWAAVAAAAEPPLRDPTPFRLPLGSVQALARMNVSGTVFATDNHGGYLIWALYPHLRPYIDTRLVLRTAEEFSEYLDIADDPRRFDAFQARHKFDFVVLPTAYPDRYLALIAYLYRSPQWALAFTDGYETLFVPRKSLPSAAWDLSQDHVTAAILSAAQTRFSRQPELVAAARLQLARLQMVLGQFDQAKAVLHPMTGVEAAALLARCHYLLGDLALAEGAARQRLHDEPADVASMNLMALVALRRDRQDEALTWLRRALSEDPFNAEAKAIVTHLEGIAPVPGSPAWGQVGDSGTR